MTVAEYLTVNWSTILWTVGLVASGLATVKNLLTHFRQGPKIAEAETVIDKVADCLSVVAKAGHDGPLSMLPVPIGVLLGSLSVPGFMSRPKPPLVEPPAPPKAVQ